MFLISDIFSSWIISGKDFVNSSFFIAARSGANAKVRHNRNRLQKIEPNSIKLQVRLLKQSLKRRESLGTCFYQNTPSHIIWKYSRAMNGYHFSCAIPFSNNQDKPFNKTDTANKLAIYYAIKSSIKQILS